MGVVFVVLIALMIMSGATSRLDASERVRRLALRLPRSGGELALPRGSGRSAVAKPSLVSAPGPTGEEVAAIALAIALRSAPRLERPLTAREPVLARGLSNWAAAGRRRALERTARFSR